MNEIMSQLKEKHKLLKKTTFKYMYYFPMGIVFLLLILYLFDLVIIDSLIIGSFVALMFVIPLLFISLVKYTSISKMRLNITIDILYRYFLSNYNLEHHTDYDIETNLEMDQMKINTAGLFPSYASEMKYLCVKNEEVKIYPASFLTTNGKYTSYYFYGYYIVFSYQSDDKYQIIDKGKSEIYSKKEVKEDYILCFDDPVSFDQDIESLYQEMKRSDLFKSVRLSVTGSEVHLALFKSPFYPPKVSKYRQKEYDRVKRYVDQMTDIISRIEKYIN